MRTLYDGNGKPIFVPEDGKRDLTLVGTVRGSDPPVRRHFVNVMPPHQRATALIRSYIETRIERGDQNERSACRRFLAEYNGILADGNGMRIELACMDAGRGAVQFFFNIHGVGPVVWLPVLVTAANHHTTHILRETGPDRLVISSDPIPTASRQAEESAQKFIPPKIETVLIQRKQV